MPIKSRIRTIPDFPKPGIMFRDITTLLKDPEGLRLTVDGLANLVTDHHIDKVVGVDARGFIVGAPLAYKLGIGFVPARKRGKLPAESVSAEYALEYGKDHIEIHVDAIQPGEKILLVDDLIATGGTAFATASLISKLGGDLVSCAFVIDLPDLGGSERLRKAGYQVLSLCSFEGH